MLNYLTFFIAAFGAVLCELAIAHTMTFYLGNTVLWYSVTMAGYLLAFRLGILWHKRASTRQKRPTFLISALIFLSLGMGTALILLKYAYVLSGWLQAVLDFLAGWSLFFIVYFLIVFAVGFLAGCVQPSGFFNKETLSGGGPNLIYFYHLRSVGIFSACLFFVLFWFLAWNFTLVNLIQALVQLGLAAGLLWVSPETKSRQLAIYVKVCYVFMLLLICIIFHRGIDQYFLKEFYYNTVVSEGPLNSFGVIGDYPALEHRQELYHNVDIVKVPDWELRREAPLIQALSKKSSKDRDFPKGFMFYLDGSFIMRSDHEEFHNEYLVHVPIMLNNQVPRQVLVIEPGTGLIAKELVKYANVREITQISLNRTMDALAHQHPLLTYINKRVFKDLRVYDRVEDGVRFLRQSNDKYDAIFIDVAMPSQYDTCKYYSREFFALVRGHLNPDGFAVLAAPGSAFFTFSEGQNQPSLAADNKWPDYYNTLRTAGFETIQPFVINLEKGDEKTARELLRLLEGSSGPVVQDVARTMMETETKEVIAKDMVQQYGYALAEGFIMLKSEKVSLKKKYRDPGIDLYALNDERFYRAFLISFPVLQYVDQHKVNSLFRPTVINLSWWGL